MTHRTFNTSARIVTKTRAYEDDGQVVALTVRKVYESDTVTRVWVDRA